MSNSKTFSYFNRDAALPSPAGERMKDEYALRIDGNNLHLDKVDTIDLQMKINSYEASTSLAHLLKRYQRGDVCAFDNGGHPQWDTDFTGASSDLQQTINNNRVLMEEYEKACPSLSMMR